MTATEFADLLRVSPATVRRHALELGGQRVGRVWRFPADVSAPTIPNGQRGPHPTSERLRERLR